jgi:hypothetical protein
LELNQYLLYPKQTHYLYATPLAEAGGIEPPVQAYETMQSPDLTPPKYDKTLKKKTGIYRIYLILKKKIKQNLKK